MSVACHMGMAMPHNAMPIACHIAAIPLSLSTRSMSYRYPRAACQIAAACHIAAACQIAIHLQHVKSLQHVISLCLSTSTFHAHKLLPTCLYRHVSLHSLVSPHCANASTPHCPDAARVWQKHTAAVQVCAKSFGRSDLGNSA